MQHFATAGPRSDPPTGASSVGLRGARRRRGRHAGRLVLLRLRPRARRGSRPPRRSARSTRTSGRRRVRIRIGMHTGEPVVSDEGYHGVGVHRAARIMAAGPRRPGAALGGDSRGAARRGGRGCRRPRPRRAPPEGPRPAGARLPARRGRPGAGVPEDPHRRRGEGVLPASARHRRDRRACSRPRSRSRCSRSPAARAAARPGRRCRTTPSASSTRARSTAPRRGDRRRRAARGRVRGREDLGHERQRQRGEDRPANATGSSRRSTSATGRRASR